MCVLIWMRTQLRGPRSDSDLSFVHCRHAVALGEHDAEFTRGIIHAFGGGVSTVPGTRASCAWVEIVKGTVRRSRTLVLSPRHAQTRCGVANLRGPRVLCRTSRNTSVGNPISGANCSLLTQGFDELRRCRVGEARVQRGRLLQHSGVAADLCTRKTRSVPETSLPIKTRSTTINHKAHPRSTLNSSFPPCTYEYAHQNTGPSALR